MYDFVFFTDVTDTLMAYKPIGAYKCACMLREQGYSCLVVDHLHTFSLEEFNQILDLAVSENTRAVGFSSTFLKTVNKKDDSGATHYDTMMSVDSHFFPQGSAFEEQAIHLIKQKNPQCKILLGGVRAHANVNNRHIDYSMVGFSESSIINFADHLINGIELKNSHKNVWGIIIIDDKYASSYDFKNRKFNFLRSF